jgi:putative intracellular protease/amidase
MIALQVYMKFSIASLVIFLLIFGGIVLSSAEKDGGRYDDWHSEMSFLDEIYSIAEEFCELCDGEPSDDEPSDDEPGDDEPSDDEPSDDEPSDDEPSDDEPSDDEPSDDEPSDDEPSDDEPSDDEPSDDEPSDDGIIERILIVLAPVDYNDTEYSISRIHFEEQGFDVQVTSKNVIKATGMENSEVEIDVDITDVDVSDYVAVVYIGGSGVDDLELYDDLDYQGLAKETRDETVILGAISQAEKILANAWLLDGKNVAAYPEAKEYLQERGAIYLDQPVVQDGYIITANHPSASQLFAETVVAAVKALL